MFPFCILTTSLCYQLILKPIEVPKIDIEEQLSYLAFCESSNNPNAYVADDAGSPSIGLYQFKQTTWDWAIKRYNLAVLRIEIDNGNISFKIKELEIDNSEHQRIVAKAIIEDGRADKVWVVCSRKYKQYLGIK